MSSETVVENDEQIVRILHRDWIVDGILQINAFALREKETYISVNRPAIETFSDDIRDFVSRHSAFKTANDSNTYQRAMINVGDVRNISINYKEIVASLSVDVEPRNSHYKSHAGIFVRVKGKNIKGGQQKSFLPEEGEAISYDDIHMKVQYSLLGLSTVEQCQIPANALTKSE